VAQTTKFNETYLLKGDSSLKKGYSISYATPSAFVTGSAQFKQDDTTKASVAFTFETTASNDSVNDLINSLKNQGVTITTTANKTVGILSLNGDAATNYNVVATTSDGKTCEIQDLQGNKVATVTVTQSTVMDGSVTMLASSYLAQQSTLELQTYYDADGNAISANALDNYFSVSTNGSVYLKADAASIYDATGKLIARSDLSKLSTKELSATQDQTAAINIKFQVGADTTSSNKISINIEAMSAKGLGLNGLKVSTTNTADAAVNTVSAALQKVSRQRSTLGAIQNRLEHTINNLDNVVENTTSAESQIRDTDMATEMVTYSNSNILAQAGQAMLAQANQSNQGVLTLLG
jgi:flagellin